MYHSMRIPNVDTCSLENAMIIEPNSVDVVIPVYNGEGTISAALDSIIDQKGNWVRKILVIDDGSLDKTVNVVRSRNSSVIQLFEIPHGGVAKARNYGVSQASGEWIAFLDADDIWRIDKLDKQMTVAKEKGYKFISAEAIDSSRRNSGPINAIDLWGGNFVVTSSVCVHITLVKQVLPLFQNGMSFAEDYLAWLKCLSIEQGFHINERLVDYAVSRVPRYQLIKIIYNLTLLIMEYHKFTILNRSPFQYKVFSMALPFGLIMTMASISKRFFKAHIKRQKAT